MPAKPISAIALEELNKALKENPMFSKAAKVTRPKPNGPMSPDTLHTIGGLADAAGTYYFMKRGTGVESNPLVTAIAGTSPARTGLAALGGLAATKGLKRLIGKKWPRVADALAANLGAEQLALGFNNFDDLSKQSSFSRYGDTMIRSAIEQARRGR